MTPTEEAAMHAVIVQVTEDAMNDGIMAAVQMMRLGVERHPHLTTLQLADAIETSLIKGMSGRQ
jgi:hypothetical protein